jgi:hypothetical protein
VKNEIAVDWKKIAIASSIAHFVEVGPKVVPTDLRSEMKEPANGGLFFRCGCGQLIRT